MSRFICRICLRTDMKIQDIEERLVDFHDEISEYAIYENAALKYCSVCEYLLRKFYNFSLKCRKANKILKEYKLKKNMGFTDKLHELLPLPSIGCSIPSTLKQFNLINGTLEPLAVQILVKQEIDSIALENDMETNDIDSLERHDEEDSDAQTEEPGSNNVVRILNVSDLFQTDEKKDKKTLAQLANIDLGDEGKSTKNIKLKESEDIENDDENTDDFVKFENGCFGMQESEIYADSSDTEMINEFKKQIQPSKSKTRVRKIGTQKIAKQRQKLPLKNMKEYENVFEIQLFATYQEAKKELELRKTSEPYLGAEHKCTICYVVYKYAKLLEFHMRWHNPSAGNYECEVCRMRFKDKLARNKHQYSAHIGKFKCKKCPLITYHKIAMQTHYQQHAGVTHTCKLCNHTFKHSSTYKSHLRLRHKTGHVCVTCARTFVSDKGLMAHRNMIHQTKSKVDDDATAHCAPCELTFANEQVYTVHLKNTDTHQELAKTIIACKLCGVRFDDDVNLRDHRRSQHPRSNIYLKRTPVKTPFFANNATGKNSYKCTICGIVGTSHSWVFKHVAAEHPDSAYVEDLQRRRQHMCETCGKRYTTIYALRDHINTHSGDKPYPCPSCPARFTSRVNLKIHAEWHAPAKRECALCGKKFVTSSNLANHMRSHIQDRRYKCSLCHKGFLHAASLREHVRGVHHNVRRVRKLRKRDTHESKERHTLKN